MYTMYCTISPTLPSQSPTHIPTDLSSSWPFPCLNLCEMGLYRMFPWDLEKMLSILKECQQKDKHLPCLPFVYPRAGKCPFHRTATRLKEDENKQITLHSSADNL